MWPGKGRGWGVAERRGAELCVNIPGCLYPPGTYMNSEALSELNVHPGTCLRAWEAASLFFSFSPNALVGNSTIRQKK